MPAFKVKKHVTAIFSLFLIACSAGKAHGAGGSPEQRESALKGVGGLERYDLKHAERENVVRNGGFELGGGEWLLGRCFAVDEEVSRSGVKSLRYEGGIGCGAARQKNLFVGHSSFRMKAWVRSERLTGGIPVMSVFDSTHGNAIMAKTRLQETSNEWRQIESEVFSVLSDHSEDVFDLRIYFQPKWFVSGTVWFDDVEIVPIYPDYSMFVTYPNFRGYLWEDGRQTVEADIEISTGKHMDPEGLLLDVSVVNASSGEIVDFFAVQIAGEITELKWDSSKMDVGEEVLLRTALKRKNGETLSRHPDYRIVKTGKASRETMNYWIDEDNYLRRRGKREYVWGVYDRMSKARKPSLSNTVEGYESIKGFDGMSTIENYADTESNVVLYFSPMSGANPGFPKIDNDQIGPWMRALSKKDVMHLQIVNNYYDGHKYRPSWSKGIAEKEMWSLIGRKIHGEEGLGFYTADEPDLTGRPTLREAFQQYGVLKRESKGSIAYQVLYRPASIRLWRDSADVFGIDPYPIGSGPIPDDYLYGDGSKPQIGRVGVWTDEAVKAVKGRRPVWVVLQLFKKAGEFPAYDDMRKMAWKAVISGANGILWWGFVSGSGIENSWYGCSSPPCDKKPYENYRRISREVMELESVLLLPVNTGLIEVYDERVKVVAKKEGRAVYVFATNRTDEYLKKVKFTCAGSVKDEIEVYAEERHISAKGSSWSDDFKRQDVHVYRFTVKAGL